MTSRPTSTLFAAAIVALTACGGGDGGPTGPEPGPGVRLELAPGSLLLEPGTRVTVTAWRVDAAGGRTAVAATIESSNPSIVSVSGAEVAAGAVGSAVLTARAGGLTAPPVLALVARPAAGALLVADSQVTGTPEPVDAAAPYGTGWQYRVRLRGADPVPGQIVLASGGALVAGRVVAVSADGADRVVTLELRPLSELFQELSVAATLPLPAPAPPQAGAATATAATMRPSHVRAALNQVDTEFELGSFECKASGSAGVSNFTLISFPLTVTPDLSLEFAANTSGLQRLAVTGSIAAAQEFRPRFNGTLTGEVDCHAILFAIPFPVNGPLGWFIAGKLPIGAGFTLKAEVTTALMGVDLDLHGQATATVGIDCAILCHPVGEFATTTTGTTLKPVLPDLGTSFHAKLAGSAYIYTEFGIGNPIIESFYIDLISAKGGLTQTFDLATREYQATDPLYASSFELRPMLSIATTARIGEAADVLGFELPPLTWEPEFDPVARSPVGTLQITPAQVQAGDGTAVGEPATFTVTMDTVDYLGAYAIEGVEIRWKKTAAGGGVTLEPGRPGCSDLAAAQDQRVFTCSTDFLDSQVGAQTFDAFVKARIFGVPVIVPLEIRPEAAATVTVTGPAPAGIALDVADLFGPHVDTGVLGNLDCDRGTDLFDVPVASSLSYTTTTTCSSSGSDPTTGQTAAASATAQHGYTVVTASGTTGGSLTSIRFDASSNAHVEQPEGLSSAGASLSGMEKICFQVPQGVSGGWQIAGSTTAGSHGWANIYMIGTGGANQEIAEGSHPIALSGRFVAGDYCFRVNYGLRLQSSDINPSLTESQQVVATLTFGP